MIIVMRCSSETAWPRRKSSVMAKMPSSRASLIYSKSASSVYPSNFGLWTWQTPVSRERTDFRKHSDSVLPMPMTSPVAFIWVPRVFGAVANLSKGKRGNFATM